MERERRYTEEEVARILDRATEVQPSGGHPGGASDGMTLAELHEIGREVGISTDLITRAASSIDRVEAPVVAQKKLLGVAIGVGRTANLPRPLTDAEWNHLVVDLRETFDARGKLREEGAFRQWTNSNLQALLEPTETGQRLRLKTLKANGRARLAAGPVMVGVGTVGYVASLVIGPLGGFSPTEAVTIALIGAAMWVSARVTLPGWARTREQQMEGVIERLTAAIEAPATD